MLLSFVLAAQKPLVLKVDSATTSFDVRLPANPTTGYQWSLKQYDKKNFILVNSTYVQNPTQRIGAGGEMIFTFKPNGNGVKLKKTNMVFIYSRSFEVNSAKKQCVNITFVSKSKKH